MSRKFQVGDRVRVIKGPSKHVGLVTTILSGPHIKAPACPECGATLPFYFGETYYGLDTPTTRDWHKGPCAALVTEDCLAPHYDGNEKTSWSDCVWQPKNVEVRS